MFKAIKFKFFEILIHNIFYYLNILIIKFNHLKGFINMIPQVYINYKLKSVEHLVWKNLTYRFLNTIIDDLFAFVVEMPTLQRISVFRDGKLI